MMAENVLNFVIKDPLELNLSFISFVTGGGLFVPTKQSFALGQKIQVELLLENQNEKIKIEGKVVWITPLNALHHVLPGVGIQFIGDDAKATRAKIESLLSKGMDVGGYTCGITETSKGNKIT